MTLLLGALAIGLLAATVLWKIGQQRVRVAEGREPHPLSDLVMSLSVIAIGGFLAWESWSQLNEISRLLHRPPLELPSDLAARMDDARTTLVTWTGLVAIHLVNLISVIPNTYAAAKRRGAELGAKPQEPFA